MEKDYSSVFEMPILRASWVGYQRNPIGWARDTNLGVISELVKIKTVEFSTVTYSGAKDTTYNI